MTNRRYRKKKAASARRVNGAGSKSHFSDDTTRRSPAPSSCSSFETQTDNTNGNNSLIDKTADPTTFSDTSDTIRDDELAFELEKELDLQAGTLCGRRLEPNRLKGSEDYFRFGDSDREWIFLHFLACVDDDDDSWFHEEYVPKFTKRRLPENQYWDGRWCMGRFRTQEQVPWYTKLLHQMLHLDWIKIDDFWGRRKAVVGIRARFGIIPDPRSIFWLNSDLFAFYALDRTSSQGAFYWCTEEFFDCYLMAKDGQELKVSLDPMRRKHLKAYLPGLARVNGCGRSQDSDEEES